MMGPVMAYNLKKKRKEEMIVKDKKKLKNGTTVLMGVGKQSGDKMAKIVRM